MPNAVRPISFAGAAAPFLMLLVAVVLVALTVLVALDAPGDGDS